MHPVNHLFRPALLALALAATVQAESPATGEITCTEERLHEKIRSRPYPRAEHKLFLNPPPLLFPVDKKNGGLHEFQLSRDPAFTAPDTITSAAKPWPFFNAHRALEPGVWHWRHRVVKDGKPVGWTPCSPSP